MTTKKAFETKLNIILSKLLNEKLELQSIAETRQRIGRPDILIFIGGIKIVLEGSYSKKDAEDDIKKKIEGNLGDIGIALWYMKGIPDVDENKVEKLLEQSRFSVRLYTQTDISITLNSFFEMKQLKSNPLTGWVEVSIIELADYIKEAYQFLIKEGAQTEIINEIEEKSEDFSNRFKSIDKNMVNAEKLYNIFYKLSGLHLGDYKKIPELIYVQSFLAVLLSTTFYNVVQPVMKNKMGKPLTSLDTLISEYGEKEGLKGAFIEILGVDYKPIFNTAVEVVECIPSNDLLHEVIVLSRKLGNNPTLLRKDFSGRIYHKVVGDWSVRKGFATYFTTISGAHLLADLAIFSEFGKLKNTETIRTGDLTCGSGTLLNAAYSSLEDLYKMENFERGSIDLNKFHKIMLENNLWGFDAMRYSLQIASLNLVFHNPQTPLTNMNFSAIPLGTTKKRGVELGSLSYLTKERIPDYFGTEERAEKWTAIGTGNTDQKLPKFDLIIMNPPFTRATGRGGQEKGGLFGFIIDEEVRTKVLTEYERIRAMVKNNLNIIGEKYLKEFKGGTFEGIGQAGEGLLFLYLAAENLNNNGKLAFVLPKSLLSGASWFLIRTMLLEKFHIEYIVVSYDKEKGYNFSESTNLSEILIIARKSKPLDTQMTKTVMLLNKPETSFGAKSLAKAIIQSSGYADNKSGAVALTSYISRKELIDNIDNWGRFVAFTSRKLLDFTDNLNKGIINGAEIPTTRLGKIATLGVDPHQFSDMFKIINESAPDSHPVVYGGGEEQRMQMAGEFNAFVVPSSNTVQKKAHKMFDEKASYLLVPDRIWLTTAHTIPLLLDLKTLSNIFYAIKLNKPENGGFGTNTKITNRITEKEKYKALCAWLNSTWGILLILSNRQETRGAWIRLKMSHWRLLRIIDINVLSDEKIHKLATVFDNHSTKKMQRIPQQYDPKNTDPIRLSFDKEILMALEINIKDEEIKELYKQIHESFEQWF